MLVLSRRLGEAVLIDGRIRIVVLEARRARIRLGIEVPDGMPILREELRHDLRRGPYTMTEDHALSPHFSWEEVIRSATAMARGIDNSLPAELRANVISTAAHMETVRALLGGPLRVTSWYRCPALNAAIGGAKTSFHMQGLAVDFQPMTEHLELAFDAIARVITIPFDQLIIERTRDGARWIHVGFSTGTPRRQVLRAQGEVLGGSMHYERVAMG